MGKQYANGKPLIFLYNESATMWTENKTLDKLRSKAAASSTGVVRVTIEELNSILPIKRDAHFVVAEGSGADETNHKTQPTNHTIKHDQ